MFSYDILCIIATSHLVLIALYSIFTYIFTLQYISVSREILIAVIKLVPLLSTLKVLGDVFKCRLCRRTLDKRQKHNYKTHMTACASATISVIHTADTDVFTVSLLANMVDAALAALTVTYIIYYLIFVVLKSELLCSSAAFCAVI